MVENYQQEQELKEPESSSYSFATIGSVYEDGISLIFPGSTSPSEKHYKANTSCIFESGQRVYLAKDSGTYIVLFPVGNPTTSGGGDEGGETGGGNWGNPITLSITGDAEGSVQIDGSQNVALDLTVNNFNEKHTSSRIKFFNGSGLMTKQQVTILNGTPTVTNLKEKLNDLLYALEAYGLINA